MAEEIIPLKTADRVSGGLSKVVLLERDVADFYFFLISFVNMSATNCRQKSQRLI